jgi:hypothetical protein
MVPRWHYLEAAWTGTKRYPGNVSVAAKLGFRRTAPKMSRMLRLVRPSFMPRLSDLKTIVRTAWAWHHRAHRVSKLIDPGQKNPWTPLSALGPAAFALDFRSKRKVLDLAPGAG